ncbi:gustatory and odorant receptor 63a-like [Bacillus rossius redtenbacheri]|uniref:gustatory and odorant receptor 63a-like n=1 Tax=Bacillus rossius redtenbacheri TaxID=93214 RepID=UPI002FDCA226
MVATVAAYSAVLFSAVSKLQEHLGEVSTLDETKLFDSAVRQCGLITEPVQVALIPARLWLTSRGLRRYFSRWRALELDHRAVTSRTLVPLASTRVRVGACLVAALCLGVCLPWAARGSASLGFLLAYSALVFTNLLAWCALCSALGSSARQLSQCLHAQLSAPSARPWTPQVAGYPRLWLRLSDLETQTGDVLCLNFLVDFLNASAKIAIYVYRDLVSRSGTAHFFAALNILILFLSLNAAYDANREVNTIFREKLLTLHSETKEEDLKQQLLEFIYVTSCGESKNSLGGFLTCDRSLFTAMFQALVMYVVILLQLQMQFSSGPDSRCNSTSGNTTVAERTQHPA